MAMLLILGALAAGILIAPDVPPALHWQLLPLLCATLWLLCRRFAVASLLLFAFCFFLGLALYQLQIAPPAAPGDIRHFIDKEPVVIDGKVLALSFRPESGSRIEVEARRITRQEKTSATSGKILLTLRQGNAECLPGDSIRFSARLRAPRLFGTPGEYDYPRKLAAAGIFVTASLNSDRDLVLLSTAPAGAQRWLERQRVEVARFIHLDATPPQAALVVALATGDQSGISSELRQLLTRGGVSHLFAISGQNLGLIAVGLVLLASLVWRRFEFLLLTAPPARILPLLAAPAVLLFFLWSGASVSALRALLMFLVGVTLLLFARRTHPLQLLATAAFAILLLQPASIFEPSFQLSFAGLAGIMLLVPPLQPRLAPLPAPFRWLLTLALATVAATLATLPLVLFHFHFIAPAGLMTNLVAVPLVGCIIVPLTLLATLLLPFSTDLATWLYNGSGILLEGMVQLVANITSWPGLDGFYFYATPLQSGAIFLAVAAAFFPWRHPWHPYRMAAAGLGLMLFFLPYPHPPAPALTVFSVGQGESQLLTLADGSHLLIDGGGLYGSTFDTGERLVAPALGRLGVTRLEAVVMTHSHPDHARGLAHILANFPVASFWYGQGCEIPADIAVILSQRTIPQRAFPSGWTSLPRPPGESLALFLPYYPASANDASLSILAGFGQRHILLPADLERSGIEELIQQTTRTPLVLLKLPHHGSRHSAPGQLLDHFPPELTFVSAGAGNRFGFPHPETLAALNERSLPIWRTDLDGTIRFTQTNGRWTAKRWKDGDFH